MRNTHTLDSIPRRTIKLKNPTMALQASGTNCAGHNRYHYSSFAIIGSMGILSPAFKDSFLSATFITVASMMHLSSFGTSSQTSIIKMSFSPNRWTSSSTKEEATVSGIRYGSSATMTAAHKTEEKRKEKGQREPTIGCCRCSSPNDQRPSSLSLCRFSIVRMLQK